MGTTGLRHVNARRVSLIAFGITILGTIAMLIVRAIKDPNGIMSSQTMVLAFPVFMAMMTRKAGRYPRIGASIACFAASLAIGALYVSIGQ